MTYEIRFRSKDARIPVSFSQYVSENGNSFDTWMDAVKFAKSSGMSDWVVAAIGSPYEDDVYVLRRRWRPEDYIFD